MSKHYVVVEGTLRDGLNERELLALKAIEKRGVAEWAEIRQEVVPGLHDRLAASAGAHLLLSLQRKGLLTTREHEKTPVTVRVVPAGTAPVLPTTVKAGRWADINVFSLNRAARALGINVSTFYTWKIRALIPVRKPILGWETEDAFATWLEVAGWQLPSVRDEIARYLAARKVDGLARIDEQHEAPRTAVSDLVDLAQRISKQPVTAKGPTPREEPSLQERIRFLEYSLAREMSHAAWVQTQRAVRMHQDALRVDIHVDECEAALVCAYLLRQVRGSFVHLSDLERLTDNHGFLRFPESPGIQSAAIPVQVVPSPLQEKGICIFVGTLAANDSVLGPRRRAGARDIVVRVY